MYFMYSRENALMEELVDSFSILTYFSSGPFRTFHQVLVRFPLLGIVNSHVRGALQMKKWARSCWHRPIFPARRQASIFGSAQLNFCVRNGNRWTLCANDTNFLVHLQGFEPGTHWLRVSCSTNWARGAYGILFPLGFWKMLIKNRTKSEINETQRFCLEWLNRKK